MTKPGPKRKDGARYPSGDLSRAAKHQETAPTLIKRMVERARRGAEDPLLGTVIGQMHLEGKLTHRQLAAAEAYGRLRGRFDRCMGTPRRSARSASYGSTAAHREVLLDDREVRDIRMRHAAMLIETGVHYPLLDRVCVDDSWPFEGEVVNLRRALDGLAKHFAMES